MPETSVWVHDQDLVAAASVSRSTAYRYFPDERALLVAAHPEIAATTMLPPDPPTDVGERLDAFVRNFSESTSRSRNRSDAPPAVRHSGPRPGSATVNRFFDTRPRDRSEVTKCQVADCQSGYQRETNLTAM